MSKEALFNVLNNHFNFSELKVLELFAGTGSISYEFASRGCTPIICVDGDMGCVNFIKKTSKEYDFDITAIKSDAFKFLEKHRVLTWEVNFWAWLETTVEDWNPIWYAGDHNDTMFELPGRFIAHRLGERYTDTCYRKENAVLEIKTSVIDYPEIPRYSPMSASFLLYPSDTNSNPKIGILNTRYVNYHILENGTYWWPSEEGKTIRTRNITSEWDFEKKKPKNFIEMKSPLFSEKHTDVFSEGIEDIRLFLNDNNKVQEKEIYWIGSTLNYSPDKKIQMMFGKYDSVSGELTDANIIESPIKSSSCEKNWIPISNPDKENEMYFIYQWYPMEIGRLVQRDEDKDKDKDKKKYYLEIEIRHEMNPLVFRKIRGSSCFILDTIEGVEGWVGVVHYSEDETPTRQYFHRLILLDKQTWKPLKYTDPFYFQKIGIEFCIGFAKTPENHYTFWISQMDRDPMVMEIEKDLVPRWNTCGRWGV
jgi:hypothetical protein